MCMVSSVICPPHLTGAYLTAAYRDLGVTGNANANIMFVNHVDEITSLVKNKHATQALAYRILVTNYDGVLFPDETIATATDAGQFISTIGKVVGTELEWFQVHTAAALAAGATEEEVLSGDYTHMRIQFKPAADMVAGEVAFSAAGRSRF